MPKSCVAVNCSNHNLKQTEKCSFHVFPKCKERRLKWIQAVKRQKEDGSKWQPSKHAVLCGKHFIQGHPSSDPDHPDYVPSVFPHAVTESGKSTAKIRRYESAQKRRRLAPDCPVTRDMSEGPGSKVSDKDSEEPAAVDEPVASAADPLVSHQDISPSERQMMIQKQMEIEIENLRAERDDARAEAKNLRDRIDHIKLSATCIRGDDQKAKYHTGLHWDVFLCVFQFLESLLQSPSRQPAIPLMDQFFLTLVKLRFGLPFQFIAERTGHSNTSIIRSFWQWIDLMFYKLSFLIKAPDHETALKILPPHFKAKFPRLTCIIDCFEIFIDQPKNLKARAATYSNYKKHTTVKFLIGCTPQGSISFVSQGWGGRVSDVELVRRSGFIDPDRHRPGDQILADRGVTLQDDFAIQCRAQLIIPSFTKGKKQLSAREVETSRNLASVRIHIERIIGLMKNRYTILQGTLPINVIKSAKDEAEGVNIARVDKIVTVCAILVNLGEGIVLKEK